MSVRCRNMHSYPPALAFTKRVHSDGLHYTWAWQKRYGDLELELELSQTSLGMVRRSVIWKGMKSIKLDMDQYLDRWPDNHEEMCDIVDDPEYHFRILMI